MLLAVTAKGCALCLILAKPDSQGINQTFISSLHAEPILPFGLAASDSSPDALKSSASCAASARSYRVAPWLSWTLTEVSVPRAQAKQESCAHSDQALYVKIRYQ